jgi:uncharacterized membrane protein YoaK (UPF0700 family)
LIEPPGRAEGLIQINPRRILSVVYGPYRIRDSLHLDMNTLDNAASPLIRRDAAGDRAGAISALIEIVLLVVVGLVHNRLPNIAGTLGTSFVAAMQTAVFTKVEGVPYSSVMATGNLRQAIENAYAAVSDGRQSGTLRLSGIFAALCVAFGIGAAVGACATERIPDLALVLPVAALLTVWLHRKV